MEFVAPAYNKKEIDRAGDFFCREGNDPVFDAESIKAFLVAENWRASHSYPLQIVRNNLANRAKKVSGSAVVAQRLKRFESIVSKLQREPQMKLSQMQDLGGCRAILPSVEDVDELLRVHREAWSKAPHRHELHRCKDYISSPKESGYRGIHLIYKFRTNHDERIAHNGQRIEVQIRSRLQHVWATAVEVVGAFRKQSLKSGQGSEEWRRLFALMGSALAKKEKRQPVPNTPDDVMLYKEIQSLSREIKAEPFLAGCSEATVYIERAVRNARAYLIVLNVDARRVNISPQDSMQAANEKYAELEKENRDKPHLQTVLVSVDSLRDLKTAYPNYYLDVSQFLTELRSVTGPFKIVLSRPPAR